jgi:hypothetical protein
VIQSGVVFGDARMTRADVCSSRTTGAASHVRESARRDFIHHCRLI